MCGITGYWFFKDYGTDPGTLEKMSKVIAHRGPDDEGFVLINTEKSDHLDISSELSDVKIKKNIPSIEKGSFNFKHDLAMAHRRFSIIDLSYSAHQPMWNKDKSICIVYNGEIFNYIELRNELIQKGISFNTNSDTEVILESYQMWGKEAFKKFSGFWAISIYDKKKRVLILSRDRIGKKPLYYYKDKDIFVWGSEIKSILQMKNRKNLDLNEAVIYNYLVSGIKDFKHTTFFKDINMLDNASVCEISESGGIKNDCFWELPGAESRKISINFSQAAEEFRELLANSLRERLRADVPVAFELSGGLDSSTLVALRAGLLNERFPVFSVKYDDKRVDESGYAISLVRKLHNIDHHIINFEEENLWSYFKEFLDLMEEPFHGPVLLIGQILRRKIAEKGYRVIIGGAGGDEVLGGYTEYAIPVIRKLLSEGQYGEAVKNIIFYKEKYPLSFFPLMSLIFRKIFRYGYSNAFYDNYLTGEKIILPELKLPKDAGDLFTKNMMDLKMYYWMSSSDKSDMGIPAEVRNPFLDYRVVDYLFKLPESIFFKNGWLKWFLRYSFKDMLPGDILWRKRKQGFPFPAGKWLDKNKEILIRFLNEHSNRWVDNSKVIVDYDNLSEKDPNFLWRIINFQMWLSYFVNGESIDSILK
ncbi:MAG: asparagine synthase (glutamine-hydrolyzing) [Acidobacteriota bacterium]